ncbi:M24 family metallopeptidase [Cellulosilyticum sp. I15G10I2]|uniref:M24 family metallopeptidase n=1 Tax=Cellulosilyticum sp. I15G10I2 TaxID=1892843 RepID=UPI00085C5CF0|nr:M24 family metallopeptidase [Cellulosilyticum sp. I15G10I2]
MTRQEDFLYKVEAIRNILREKNFEGIEIKSQANFSYVTRGRGFIGLASTVACGSLFITLDHIYLVSENIEIMRLYNEQLDSNPSVCAIGYPWDEPQKREEVVSQIIGGLKMATEGEVEAELFKLRTIMTPYDREEYKKLSYDTAVLIEEICKNLKKGISEYELAGEISGRLWSNNIEPITILIAFDERALRYRHPVMAGNRLENYGLVGICGRRNGLIVSLSRDVLLDYDEDMVEKHTRCAMVHAAFLSGLKIGNTVESAFGKGLLEYQKQGYPLEYKEHHQGGLTGFIPRELRANIGCTHSVRRDEAYAFNPTIQGSKCEDTVLVTENGIEIITYTGNYAYITCDIDGEKFMMPTVYVVNKR